MEKYYKGLDKFWFGGNRWKAIKRDNNSCVKCGMTDKQHRKKWGRGITVDHIDNKGRYSKKRNNAMENLQTLCLKCHGEKDGRGWRKTAKGWKRINPFQGAGIL